MVVCKFFQRGHCSYGSKCHFEHIYGSQYSYHAKLNEQQNTGVTDEQLTNQVRSEVESVLKGGQWILSCYAPFKEKPNFPGISDLSPEEARLIVYEARNKNNIDQVITYINNLTKETRGKYEQLLQTNANIVRVLRSLYKGEQVISPFTATQNTATGYNNTSNASSLFRSAIQNPGFGQSNTKSIFAQAVSSVFGQQNASEEPSIWGSQTQATQNKTAQSVFAQANQSIFTPQAQTSPSNLFASANQCVFGSQMENNPMPNTQQSNQSIFSQNNQTNVFTQNSSEFAQSSPFTQNKGNMFTSSDSYAVSVPQNVFEKVSDTEVYSKMNDLSAEDIDAFNSDSFTLGFVPEVAPPRELCF